MTNSRKLPCILVDHRASEHTVNQITVNAGNQSCIAMIQGSVPEIHRLNGLVQINKPASRALLLPEGRYYPYYKRHYQHIFLGPIIGVISSALKNGYLAPGGKNGRLFKELIICGRKRGVFIYLFAAQGVNKSGRTIKGLTVNARSQWIIGNFPWPDIVYNRIRKRSIEKQTGIRELLQSFEKTDDVYLFNSRFLDKWEVYQAFQQNPEAKSLMPETSQFNSDNLEKALLESPQILLKPRDGSIGKGIIKVAKTDKQHFCFRLASKKGKEPVKAASMPELIAKLERAGVNNIYLIQKCIDLSRYKGEVFDIRAQVQKDGTGKWVLTGAAVRRAGRNRFVTHIPNGGRAESYNLVIDSVFKDVNIRRSLELQLQNIVGLIPGLLEKELHLNLAILSMDIGIDQNGRMWVFEVNSKPSNFDENHIHQKHLEYLIDYFIFIAGANKKEE